MTFRTICGKVPLSVTPTRTNLVPVPGYMNPTAGIEIRRNLCTNPSFAVNTTGWINARCSAVVDTTVGHVGTSSMKLTVNDVSSIGGLAQRAVAVVPGIVPGKVYSASAYVWSDLASGITTYGATMQFKDSGGTVVAGGTFSGAQNYTAAVATDHTLVKIENITAPAGAASVDVWFGPVTATQIQLNDVFWVDAACVEESVVALPYFDGSMAAADGLTYQWTGTAHLSASQAVGARSSSTAGYSGAKAWTIPALAPDGSNVQTVYALSGTNTLQMIDDASTAMRENVYIAGRIKIRAIAAGNRTVNVSLNNYNGGSGLTATTNGVVNVSLIPNTWTEISLTSNGLTPTSINNSRFLIYVGSGNGGWLAGERIEIAQRHVEEVAATATAAGPIFSGNTPEDAQYSYAFSGTANSSTSYAFKKQQLSVHDGGDFRALTEVPKRTNLVTNPSFRTANAGMTEVRKNWCTTPNFTGGASMDRWTCSGADLTIVNGRLRATATSTGSKFLYWGWTAANKYATAAPNQWWTASMTVTHSVGGSRSVYLPWLDSAGTQLGTLPATANTFTAGVPLRVSISAQAPASTAYASLAHGWTANAVGDYIEIEKVQLEYATGELPYFDAANPPADTPNGWPVTWTGTAWASPSLIQAPQIDGNMQPYTATPSAAVGGQVPGQEKMRMISRNTSFPLWSFQTTADSVVNIGDYIAGRYQIRQIGGTGNVTIKAQVGIYTSLQGSFQHYTATGLVMAIPPNSGWIDVDMPPTEAVRAIGGTLSARLMCYTNGGGAPLGATLEVRRSILEKVSGPGVSAGPYFDGTMPQMLRHNLCPYPQPTSLTGWATAVPTLVDAPWDATRKAVRGTASGVSTFYIFSGVAQGPFYPGEVFTCSATVQVPAGKWYKPFVHARTGNSYMPAQGSVAAVQSTGAPVRVSQTFTLTAIQPDIDFALLCYETNGTTNLAAGDQVYMGDVMIERVAAPTPYFDGSTPPVPGKIYSWLGADANASSVEYSPDYTYAWTGLTDKSQSEARP